NSPGPVRNRSRSGENSSDRGRTRNRREQIAGIRINVRLNRVERIIARAEVPKRGEVLGEGGGQVGRSAGGHADEELLEERKSAGTGRCRSAGNHVRRNVEHGRVEPEAADVAVRVGYGGL